ncbi:NHL repeat-containing protein [Spongiimicrobium sp. 3-5]|uniref:NHL repeat-containing protein n=1 Tax=Spongiimicrobium sp. 3-5 TaxID=3332596 RepID=UPI003980C5F8
MKKVILVSSLIAIILGCSEKAPKEMAWSLTETIQIEGVNPIGIAALNSEIWLSDGDHNRLVKIDEKGKVVKTIDSLDRPMHIAADESALFIPQYGLDNVAVFNNGKKTALVLKDSLDAPAGISVYKNEKAIADFYNNRILYSNGNAWITFGKEGNAAGEFYYPTDVQITSDRIWVADAYNNRVQVFNKQGEFLRMIGVDQKMNAATGIYVSDREVFVTDFENDRVLIFDFEGNLKQELKEAIHKPTDILIKDDALLIINYRDGRLNRYELKEKLKI